MQILPDYAARLLEFKGIRVAPGMSDVGLWTPAKDGSFVSLTKDLGICSAAHQLVNHGGKCRNLHGHDYRIAATIGGYPVNRPGQPDTGMVVDFSVIKDLYKVYIEAVMDHAFILGTEWPEWYTWLVQGQLLDMYIAPTEATAENIDKAIGQVDTKLGKVLHIPYLATTAENMAAWIYHTLHDVWRTDVSYWLDAIEVWETPSSSATYLGGVR